MNTVINTKPQVLVNDIVWIRDIMNTTWRVAEVNANHARVVTNEDTELPVYKTLYADYIYELRERPINPKAKIA